MDITEVLVIGGGPAGIFAAAAAATAGAKVTLLEKNNRLGCKMRLTGGGRGNLTNTAPLTDFIDNVPGNGKFLHSALNRFSCADCREFFHGIGVPTKEEDNGRVFPVSEDAGTVVQALEGFLAVSGVRVVFSSEVTGLVMKENNCQGVLTSQGRVFHGKAVVIATGGISYPQTGSTGNGYNLARQAGHQITPLFPSLVPLCLAEVKLCRQLQGLSLKGVKLALTVAPDIKPMVELGEVVFTHFGLSGPAALRLSREAAKRFSASSRDSLRLTMDLLPEKSEDELICALQNLASSQPQKTPLNILKQLLPNRIAELCAWERQIDPNQKSGVAGKKTWRSIARWIKNLTFTVTATRPIAEAMVTAGGISLGQIESGAMSSRLSSGLYFAGEVLDLDAYSGGFNLHIAFATGWTAGRAAAEGIYHDSKKC